MRLASSSLGFMRFYSPWAAPLRKFVAVCVSIKRQKIQRNVGTKSLNDLWWSIGFQY